MRDARTLLAGLTLEGAEIIRSMGQAIPRLVAQGRLGASEIPLLRLLVDVVVHGRPADVLLDPFFGGTGRV